jgi:hypothetical protein
MKTTNSRLIIFAAVVAVVVVGAGTYLSLYRVPASSGSVAPPDGGIEIPKPVPPEEPPETIVKNQYPLPAVTAAYGSLQRVGSSKNDGAKESYFLGGYVYLIFYAEKNDYDSGEKNSVNMAKLDKNGAILKTALLGKGEYLSSKPVWSGIAVCLFDGGANTLVFMDFELEISAARPVFSGGTYLYFYRDRLFCATSANGILSLTAFGEDFAPSVSLSAAVPKDCKIAAMFGALELQIILTSETAFYVYKYSENISKTADVLGNAVIYAEKLYSQTSSSEIISKTADGLGNAEVIIPKKDGYIIIGKNSGIIRLYDANFVKTGEKELGGVISGIEKTAFGYAATSKTDGGSEVFFLCPHFDTLLTKRFKENLIVKNAGGSLLFFSAADGYVNLYKLSDFEIIGFLTVAASPDSPPQTTGDGKNIVVTLNAKRVSSLNSYGEDDVFALIINHF